MSNVIFLPRHSSSKWALHYKRNGLRRYRKAATVRRAQRHRTLIRLRQKRPRSSASSSSSSLIVIYDKQRARVGRKSVRRSLGQSSSGGHRPENCPMRKGGGAASAAQRWPPFPPFLRLRPWRRSSAPYSLRVHRRSKLVGEGGRKDALI